MVTHHNFLDTSTPDINLERDIIDVEAVSGMAVSELSNGRFKINIATIIISALLFLMILAWFDFIQSAFYSYLLPDIQNDNIPPWGKFWYALFSTIFIILIIILIYFCFL